MTYRLLVLPRLQTMTPGLLRKIKELVDAGATVIGQPPARSPSLAGYPQCDAEIDGWQPRFGGVVASLAIR